MHGGISKERGTSAGENRTKKANTRNKRGREGGKRKRKESEGRMRERRKREREREREGTPARRRAVRTPPRHLASDTRPRRRRRGVSEAHNAAETNTTRDMVLGDGAAYT